MAGCALSSVSSVAASVAELVHVIEQIAILSPSHLAALLVFAHQVLHTLRDGA